MFEVANFASSEPGKAGMRGAGAARVPRLVPRQILMEGDGETDKGMKVEWATVRDDTLWVGSFGKEYTDSEGNILHANNLWVKAVAVSERGGAAPGRPQCTLPLPPTSFLAPCALALPCLAQPSGEATAVDWSHAYLAMRRALGYEHPAYLLHEAITWSPHRRQWFVLPRRMSKEPYDEVRDETMGANTIIQASADWSRITTSTVGVRVSCERARSCARCVAPLPHLHRRRAAPRCTRPPARPPPAPRADHHAAARLLQLQVPARLPGHRHRRAKELRG